VVLPLPTHVLTRLTGQQANRAASRLEALGWRAEGINLNQGQGLVEVRALGVRGMPLVALLRTEADLDTFLRAWPGRRPPGPRLSPEQWRRRPTAPGAAS
jgi:hypothetical protein